MTGPARELAPPGCRASLCETHDPNRQPAVSEATFTNEGIYQDVSEARRRRPVVRRVQMREPVTVGVDGPANHSGRGRLAPNLVERGLSTLDGRPATGPVMLPQAQDERPEPEQERPQFEEAAENR